MRYWIEGLPNTMNSDMVSNKPETMHDPGHDSGSPESAERRRIERVPVHIRGILYHGDRFQTTMVENISTGGAGLNGAVGIAPGDDVTVRLVNGRELSGKVAWWLAGRCGITFHTKIHTDDPLFHRRHSQFSK